MNGSMVHGRYILFMAWDCLRAFGRWAHSTHQAQGQRQVGITMTTGEKPNSRSIAHLPSGVARQSKYTTA